MVKRISAALMLVFGMSMQVAQGAPINLVTNGDFETGTLSGWTANPDPAPLAPQFVGPDTSFSAAVHSGLVFSDAAYTQTGTISQILALTTNATYRLEFDLQRLDSNNGDIENFASASLGGIMLLLEDDIGGDWTHYTFSNLVATGPSAMLEFANRNYWDRNQLDNISLVQTSDPGTPTDPGTGTVPEPGSLLLLLAGLGLIGGMRGRAKGMGRHHG